MEHNSSSNDAIVINILDEKKYSKDESVELDTFSNIVTKSRRKTQPNHSNQFNHSNNQNTTVNKQNPPKVKEPSRRRTRSFPIESTSRKNIMSRKNTPEKKYTPPNTNRESQQKKIIPRLTETQRRKSQISQVLKQEKQEEEYKEEIITNDNINWDLGCIKIPKDCLVYVSQMLIVSCVIGVSLYNISTSDQRLEFWASLLSGSVGYILPNPTLKKK
jgi:hypothetical protein